MINLIILLLGEVPERKLAILVGSLAIWSCSGRPGMLCILEAQEIAIAGWIVVVVVHRQPPNPKYHKPQS